MSKTAPLFNRLALIGVGLIGSSIARAARAQGAVREIVAVSYTHLDVYKRQIPAFATAGAGPWWTALEFDAAPKIIARLPFVERADHPAAMPVFVVSRVAADAMVTETEVWSMRISGWNAAAVHAVAALADVIAVPDRAFDGAALLVSVERGGGGAVSAALRKLGASIRSTALVGSHATRYTVPAKHTSR